MTVGVGIDVGGNVEVAERELEEKPFSIILPTIEEGTVWCTSSTFFISLFGFSIFFFFLPIIDDHNPNVKKITIYRIR